MVKRGALSKVEKYYIEGNVNQSSEEIAKELDRTVNIIDKYKNTLKTVDKKPEQKADKKQKTKKRETQMFQVMGRHERNGEKVATVMTAAASELADATRPKRLMNKKLQKAIHKPKG